VAGRLVEIVKAAVLVSGWPHPLALTGWPKESGARSSVQEARESAERDHILKALEACNWVVGGAFGAAARLGVKRTTLMDKMRRRGLSREIFQSRESDLHCIPGAERTIDESAAV